MKVRIYEVTTETDTNGMKWESYDVAAKNAEDAIAKAKKRFSKDLKEQVLSVNLLASEN